MSFGGSVAAEFGLPAYLKSQILREDEGPYIYFSIKSKDQLWPILINLHWREVDQ